MPSLHLIRQRRLAGLIDLIGLALGPGHQDRAPRIGPLLDGHRLTRADRLPCALFGRREPQLRPPHLWTHETPT